MAHLSTASLFGRWLDAAMTALVWIASLSAAYAEPPSAAELGVPSPIPAADAGASTEGSSAEPPRNEVLEIVLAGGLSGGIIMLSLLVLSIFVMALVVEHLTSIRRIKLVPPGLGAELRKFLESNQIAEADRLCRDTPSALADVVRAGLAETPLGWRAVEKGMEEALSEQAARLFRKIDYLSVVGNIAPMLGLLGTVFGMIFAFREVANTQGAARAADLAGGIYQALVTTVGGLLVAIPSFAAFAVFRNRIDQLTGETGREAQRVMGPVKRALTQAKRERTPGQ